MKTLAIEDIHLVHQSIQQIYTIEDLDAFGVDVLEILNRLIPAQIVDPNYNRSRDKKITFRFLQKFLGYSSEMLAVADEYFDRYLMKDLSQILTTKISLSSIDIDRDDLSYLKELYQHFIEPLDPEDSIVFFLPTVNDEDRSKLVIADAILVWFSIHCNWQDFTERDCFVLGILRLHLFQAYTNALQYRALRQDLAEFQQYFDCLCSIVFDTEGKIRSIAPQAEQWLGEYFTMSASFDRLPEHLWSWAKHQITNLNLANDLAQTCLPLRIQQADRILNIRLIKPSIDRFLLLLEEQVFSTISALEMLGLSQRETEVLVCVIQGKSNNAISTHLGIQPTTVRRHLESIYLKFGVQSRTEAISQALEKIGFLYFLPVS